MSLIADVCNIMTEVAYQKALNQLYAMECDNADLGDAVLHHFRLSNLCTDAEEDCCIKDYVGTFILTEEDCGNTFSCAELSVSIHNTSCGQISIQQR